MEEVWKISGQPSQPSPTSDLEAGSGGLESPGSTGGASKGTDPFTEAAAQMGELIRRFVQEVGTHIHDAQVAADSARAAQAEAERNMQEARKARADADVEATRILDRARAEAKAIRDEAGSRAAAAEGAVREAVDDLERAHESLAAVVGSFGADVGTRGTSEGSVVIPDAPRTTPA